MLTAAQREQIRHLAHDLPALWHAPTTTFVQRKQLLRWLIKDVTLSKRGNVIDVAIRWQTEALTSSGHPTVQNVVGRTPDQPTGGRARAGVVSDPDECPDRSLLNEEGIASWGWEAAFTVSKIEWIRYAYHIPWMPRASESPHQPDNEETGATRHWPLQNCSMSTSRPLRIGAKLASWRVFALTPLGPRWITLTPEIIAAAAQASPAAVETTTYS